MINLRDLADCLFGWQKDGLLVIISCHGDESIDVPARKILCIGAVLGWPIELQDVSMKWQKRLDKDNIAFFHTAECEGLYGEFSPEKLGVYNLNSCRAIAESVRHDLLEILYKGEALGMVGLAVKLDEFKEVTSVNAKARMYYGTDPIVFGYKQLVGLTITLLDQDWPELKVPIAYTFDEHRAWREAEEACSILKTEDEKFARRMGHVGHADDKDVIPLQMADLMAYEARIKVDSTIKGSDKQRRQYTGLADNHVIYYVGYVGKEHMLSKLAELPDEKE